MLVLYLLIGVLVCLIVLSKSEQRSGIPELPGKLPVVGHSFMFLGNSEHLMDILKWIAEEGIKRGGVVSIVTAFFYKVYVIVDPKDFASITTQCLHKSPFYFLGASLFGNSILYSKLSNWKRQRKLLNPAFGPQMLNGFVEAFNEQGRRLVKQLAATRERGPFDHTPTIMINNLETSLQTILGLSKNEAIDKCDQYLRSVETIFSCFTKRFKHFWLINDYLYGLTKLKKQQDDCTRFLQNISETAIQQRKLEMDSSKTKENTTSILNCILEHNKREEFSEEEIREQLDLIVIGSFDTSASLLVYVYTIVGSYPEVQQKIYDEIMIEVGNKDVMQADLPRLVYLEAVINETLRLYPTVPIVARYTNNDIQLRNHTIPKGNTVVLLIHGLHRHPVWGPDADQFRPERWLEPSKLPKSTSFVGFSVGRRNCIGKTYAMMSMKISLVHVLRHYKVTGDISKVKHGYQIMLKPVSGNYISLEEREGVMA